MPGERKTNGRTSRGNAGTKKNGASHPYALRTYTVYTRRTAVCSCGHMRRTAVQCVSVLTAAGYRLAPADMAPRPPEITSLMQDWVSQDPRTESKGSKRSALVAKMRQYLPHLTN